MQESVLKIDFLKHYCEPQIHAVHLKKRVFFKKVVKCGKMW